MVATACLKNAVATTVPRVGLTETSLTCLYSLLAWDAPYRRDALASRSSSMSRVGQHNDADDHNDNHPHNGGDLHDQADDLAALPRQQLLDGPLTRSPLGARFGERASCRPGPCPARPIPPRHGSVRPAPSPARHLSHPPTRRRTRRPPHAMCPITTWTPSPTAHVNTTAIAHTAPTARVVADIDPGGLIIGTMMRR